MKPAEGFRARGLEWLYLFDLWEIAWALQMIAFVEMMEGPLTMALEMEAYSNAVN